ncbi:MAG TPA: hypothetical protein VGE86_09290 [Thermoanaerobaculia bacterium]
MAVNLPDGLAADQLRILQEFRRKNCKSLSMDEIASIRHPAGGGPEALEGLLAKGHVRRGADGTIEIEPKGEALTGTDRLPLPFYERG